MELPDSTVVIYSSNLCGYCTAAKRLLETKGYEYVEVNLSQEDPSVREQLLTLTNHRTVPQIFIGGQFVGGYDELYALNQTGELDERIQTAQANTDQ